MPAAEQLAPVSVARAYFALQALGGIAWWVAVFASGSVRVWTLGQWEPMVLVWPDLLLFVAASGLAAVWGSKTPAAVAAVWTTGMTLVLGIYALVEREAGWGVVLMSVATVGSLAAASTIWFGHLPTGWFFVGPFSFRVAGRATGTRHLRRSLAQLVAFWTTFFVLIPAVLVIVEERLRLSWPTLDHQGVKVAGAVVLLLGSALGLWACTTMALQGNGTPLPAETARDLVVTGPYRYVRNPMAVAGVVQTVGVGLVIGSWMVLAITIAGALVWNRLIRPTEEADLAARFGEPYRRYAEDVRCWIPTAPR